MFCQNGVNFRWHLALQGEKTWWQLTSRCFWNDARPWHASELVSFLVGLRTYQHPGIELRWLLYVWRKTWPLGPVKLYNLGSNWEMNYLFMNFRPTSSFRGTNFKFVNGGITVLDTARKMFLRNFLRSLMSGGIWE